jgi:hypothetical protein
MQQHRYGVAIVPGDGLVARFGDTMAYVGPQSSPAMSLIAAIAAGADKASLPVEPNHALAVVTPTSSGLLVLLHGHVTAEIDAEDGLYILSGGRDWVEETIPAATNFTSLTVGAEPGLVGAPHTDLHAGVVVGAGFVLAGTRANDTAISPVVPPSAETATARVVERRDAALVTDGGLSFPLDRSYVIGRNPLIANEVCDATASPITLDHDQHISRVHAYVSVDGDTVLVRDNATPGGTFISPPGSEQWTQIGAAPIRIQLGSRIRIGEQILNYRAEP